MITRYYHDQLATNLSPGKVLVIYGPRRVGKTTLINSFLSSYQGTVYQSTGEDAQLKDVLESSDFSRIIPFFSGYDLVVIDEAQYITNIGQALKILVDQIPHLRVIASGSSSFELSNKIGEPLVGRQKILHMYPVALLELTNQFGNAYAFHNLENMMIYGMYPEVLTAQTYQEKTDYLVTIRDAYLFRDIFAFEEVRNAKKILDLLRLIAFQIGQEVSHQELGTQLQISKNTVERYLDLLEKSFVLVNVRGYSGNLRKEVTKTSRYYFTDVGIRNAVIGNFNFLNSRNDAGQLWENFVIMERMKKRAYHRIHGNQYFWRTWDQKEIDLIEERDGKLHGFEIKWRKKSAEAPKDWTETYAEASYDVVNRENVLAFVT